jgi:hypothetical protein
MNEGAGIHALDALKDWYAALVQFRSEAGNALGSLTMALQRASDWLGEQQQHWRGELRRAEENVTLAKNELMARKYQDWAGRQPDTTVQEKALRQAQARLHFIEDRLEAVRRWTQRLPVAIQDTFEGPARTLSFFVDSGLPRVLAQLSRQLDAIDQYVGIVGQPAPPPAPPQTEAKP